MGIHLILDSLAVISADTGIPAIVLLVAEIALGLGVLWYAFRLADYREREFARDILRPEVTSGVLRADELEALTGHKQRRAYLKASPNRRERRRRKHVLSAAVDLCADLADSHGADSTDVIDSRAEVSRMRGRTAAPPEEPVAASVS